MSVPSPHNCISREHNTSQTYYFEPGSHFTDRSLVWKNNRKKHGGRLKESIKIVDESHYEYNSEIYTSYMVYYKFNQDILPENIRRDVSQTFVPENIRRDVSQTFVPDKVLTTLKLIWKDIFAPFVKRTSILSFSWDKLKNNMLCNRSHFIFNESTEPVIDNIEVLIDKLGTWLRHIDNPWS